MHLTRRKLEIKLLFKSVIVPRKNRHRLMFKLHKQLTYRYSLSNQTRQSVCYTSQTHIGLRFASDIESDTEL